MPERPAGRASPWPVPPRCASWSVPLLVCPTAPLYTGICHDTGLHRHSRMVEEPLYMNCVTCRVSSTPHLQCGGLRCAANPGVTTGRAEQYALPCQEDSSVPDLRVGDVSPAQSGRPQEAQNLAPGFTGAPHPGQNFGVFVGAASLGTVFS